MTHISFSFSNALHFFRQEELNYLSDYIKRHTKNFMKERGKAAIIWAGWTYRKTWTQKNSTVLKPLQKNQKRL